MGIAKEIISDQKVTFETSCTTSAPNGKVKRDNHWYKTIYLPVVAVAKCLENPDDEHSDTTPVSDIFYAYIIIIYIIMESVNTPQESSLFVPTPD